MTFARGASPAPLRSARVASWLAVPLLVAAIACGSDGGADAADGTDDAPAAVAATNGGVTTSTPTPSPTIDPELEGEDLAVAIWGQEVCSVARGFALDFLASGDPRDPSTLDLETRKQRAAAMFPQQIDVVSDALTQLEAIESPERTAEFHALLLQTYGELRDALLEQQGVVEAAETAEQIAESNLDVSDLMNLAFRQGALLENAGYCGANGDPA